MWSGGVIYTNRRIAHRQISHVDRGYVAQQVRARHS